MKKTLIHTALATVCSVIFGSVVAAFAFEKIQLCEPVDVMSVALFHGGYTHTAIIFSGSEIVGHVFHHETKPVAILMCSFRGGDNDTTDQ